MWRCPRSSGRGQGWFYDVGLGIKLVPMFLTLLGRRVEIRTEDEAMRQLVDDLWAPFASRDGDDLAGWIELIRERGSWVMRSSFESVLAAGDAWHVLLRMKFLAGRIALQDRSDLLTIHASVANNADGGVLMVGPPGAGKSTLCADACLRLGWTFLSDDVAPISISDGSIHPFPRPPAFKGTAPSWDELASQWSPPEGLRPTDAFMVPPKTVGRVGSVPVRLGCIVFPSFVPHSDGYTHALSPAKAMRSILAEVHDPTPSSVSFLGALVQTVPAYRAEYASSERSMQLLSDIASRSVGFKE